MTPQLSGRCANDTDRDGNCAACVRNPEAPCRLLQPPVAWPKDVKAAFWSATAAPTYTESAAKTLEFAHELAEMLRRDPECGIGGYGDGISDAALMIDPSPELS